MIERLTEEKYKEAADDLSKVDGGMLYTFRVEKLVCAQTDFKPGVERPRMEGKNFFIFHTLPEPIDSYRGMDEPVSRRERYQVKQQYLLFLTALPRQKQLTKKYTLDGGQTYYAAFEGKKGLIPLPTDNLPLLDNLTEFCQAVSTADTQQKIDRLNILMQSANPELRQSAAEAMRAVKQNIAQP